MAMKISKRGECIRSVSNFSLTNNIDNFDKSDADINRFTERLFMTSPKLKELIKTINIIDEYDLNNHKTLYKHVIYTDTKKSSIGSKLIAMGLVANGFRNVYGDNLRISNNLTENMYGNFALLTSGLIFNKIISQRLKRNIISIFNNRKTDPYTSDNNMKHSNINGRNIRFIILDQGYKEGIDLFDVKYVHLLEPLITQADEKQVIGRGTRLCGQRGLRFDPNAGWPLHVFRYDVHLDEDLKKKYGVDTLNDLFITNSGLDMKKLNFSKELETVSRYGAVDYPLTTNIHNIKADQEMDFSTLAQYFAYRNEQNESFMSSVSPASPFTLHSGGGENGEHNRLFLKIRQYIIQKYTDYKWGTVKLENKCLKKAKTGKYIDLSPTQKFITQYFTHDSQNKGLMLWHSVGTGKTCSAISIATTGFEPFGYTIIWVTRHTLKSDIWKNMFVDVCSETMRKKIMKGYKIPEDAVDNPYKYLSDAWIQPMSYKQFSNMLLGKNDKYDILRKRNGSHDILRKTLVIIDEVHKLFSADLPLIERPDINIIRQKIKESYTVSGKDSVRLLLMSATPYTTNPMDLIKFINLMKEHNEMPEKYEDFSRKYLGDDGKFTDIGAIEYLDSISPYISYLNREKDVQQFAYPVYYDVLVDISKKNKTMKREVINYIDELKANIVEIKAQLNDKNITEDVQIQLNESLENHNSLLKNAKQKLKDINDGIISDESQEYALEKCFQKQ